METPNIGSRQRVQAFEEAAHNHDSQPTKGWTVAEEMFDSLALLLIATYPAIVRLATVPDLCQRFNLTVTCNETNN